MAHDDRILLDQWSKQGDGEAFRTLVSRYSGVVYAACRRILGNGADAEDIAQECFEALATAGAKPGAYVGAWLHRVATYHAIGHVRREVRRKQREAQYGAPRRPESTLEWKDIYEYVDEAVNELPDKLRFPLIAHYLEGRSKQSIAQSFGLSRQLTSYRIEQGLKRVRHTLRRNGVYLGAGVLAVWMEANAAEAAPAALVAKLGKIALAGPGTAAPPAALAAMQAACGMAVGGTAVKVLGGIVALGLIVGLGLFFGWKEIRRPYPTQDITARSTFSVETSVPVEKRAAMASDKRVPEKAAPATTAPATQAVEVLEPGTVIYGIVLDEARRPVPGATVTLDHQEQVEIAALNGKLGIVEGMYPAPERVNASQTTNAQGEFVFERVIVPEREGLILAAQSGNRSAIKTVATFGELRQRRHELVLAPAGFVRGRIVDESNKGIPNVRIYLSPQRMINEIRPFRLLTKEDGSFCSRPLALGMYELMFNVPGYKDPGRPWFNADGQQHVMRMERAGMVSSISGWVVDIADGRRLPGVEVGSGLSNATTNANGEFRFDNLPASKYSFGLSQKSAPYVLVEMVKIELTAGQDVSGLELKAARGVTVSGRILDAETGQPVPKAYIQALGDGIPVLAYATADEDGRYALNGLAAGDYRVRFRKAGNYIMKEEQFTLPSLQNTNGVDFILGPYRSVRGKVTNASGMPVEGAAVVALPMAAFIRMIRTSDASGAFEFVLDEKIPSVYVQAYGDGTISRCLGPFRPGETCDLELEASGAIEGTVVDTSGRPIVAAIVAVVSGDNETITAISPDGSEWDPERGIVGTKARTTSMGSFLMEPLLPGRYSIEVYLPSSARGYPVATTPVSVQAGETLQTRLVVDLGGMATIAGTVTQGGSPLPYTIVEAYAENGDWVAGAETHTDANGAYALTDIRPGKVRITAWEPGGARRMSNKTVELAEDETQTVDFEFELYEGGVEGTVTINGKPGYADISVNSSGSEDSGTYSSVMTSPQDGYYRVTNLAPGTYTVSATSIRSQSPSNTPRETIVQITGGETVRCDITFESGSIEGTVQGLNEGEAAGIGLFTEPLDFGAMSASSVTSLVQRAVASELLPPGQSFKWDDLQPGIYYLGVVPLPAGDEPDETAFAAAVAKRRFFVQQVEVAAAETTTVTVVLPK